jgi:hypothetical protein
MRTMIFLLIDDNFQNFDVIAIQKFWRNLFVSITLSFNQSDFHLFYKFDEDTKICFYVNDKLNTNNWNVEYFTIDICTLKIKINDLNEDLSTIHIHNVYNFSLIFYSSRDSSFTLSKTRKFLVDAFTNHYILLENFNLRHFFWNDSSKSTQHAITNELLKIIKQHDLTLTLFKKFITWKNRVTASIIDFTFMTIHLMNKLKHCTTRSDLNQSLNHISISTRILCEIESNSFRISRRAWTSIDLKKIKKAEKKRVDFVTLVIDSRDRWIRVWSSKILAVDDEEDRILTSANSVFDDRWRSSRSLFFVIFASFSSLSLKFSANEIRSLLFNE